MGVVQLLFERSACFFTLGERENNGSCGNQ
jgi:hypothetical protein